MTDPMTPERLADRRKKIKAEHVERRYFYGAECSCGECLPCVVLADELAWLDGVERLRVELAAFVPPGALGAGETPALCGTCKDRLCVPGLPGCARCVAEQVDRLSEEERRQRETADAASRGWRIEVAEVERLRAELAEKERRHSTYVQSMRDSYNGELDRLKRNGEALIEQLGTAEAERDAARRKEPGR